MRAKVLITLMSLAGSVLAAEPEVTIQLREHRFTPSEIKVPAGTKVSYQSMGTAMLAEIVHQVTGASIREFLQREIFQPLGMADTSLGWQPEKKERIAAVRIGARAAEAP